MITEAQYTDPDEGTIRVVDDGVPMFIPNAPGGRHWGEIEAWQEQGGIIAAYEAPPLTADDVRLEARRRILAVYPEWRQTNMTARGVELLRIGEPNWSPSEQGEADALQAAWDWIKSVRAASNVLDGINPILADFADDQYWP